MQVDTIFHFKDKISGVCLTMAMIAGLLLPGCDLARNHFYTDRASNMEVQDFRDALEPNFEESDQELAQRERDSEIPDFQSYVASPSESLRPMPLVSISLDQSIPLRETLYDLASSVGYDIELDPGISGAIIFTAKNKPFDFVIGRIAELAGLRYKFSDETLRIEIDRPYLKTYKVDYINQTRESSSNIENQVSVVSGDAKGGSDFTSSSETSSDFWADLDSSLQQVLGMVGATMLRTEATPQIETVSRNSPPVSPIIPPANGEQGVVEPPQAILEVGSLPPVSAAGGSGGGTSNAVAAFNINKQAGIVSVFATDKQHEAVGEFLYELKRSTFSQVLIEAKVFEVVLSDEFSMGIDWNASKPFNKLLGGSTQLGFDTAPSGRPGLVPGTDNPFADFFISVVDSSEFGFFADALSRFGTVRALASPRVTVLNNQPAALTVAENRVFFEVALTEETDDDTGDVTIQIESSKDTVPEGVLINVLPSIDVDGQIVTMSLRPTVTSIVDVVNDPGTAVIAARLNVDVQSEILVVNVQEIDSVVRMRSGKAVVLGGLMQDRIDTERTGVPVLSEMPVLGGLFRTHTDKIEKTELVVFIKATIIENFDTVDKFDRELYRKFSGDRRPLGL